MSRSLSPPSAFQYDDAGPNAPRPHATLGLMLLLSVLALVSLWDSERAPDILRRFGLVPALFDPLAFVTYMFLHASVVHLGINLVYLWFFGAGVELAVGKARYLLLFLGGGLLGGVLQWLVGGTVLSEQAARVPIIGASAACVGLMGLFAWRYYRARLTFLPYQPHVIIVVAFFLCYEMGGGLFNLVTGNLQGGVAHWAHIGGFVFGMAAARVLKLDEAARKAYQQEDAERSLQHNDPGAAILRWESLLAKEPGNIRLRQQLARSWLALGDQEQAAHQVGLALETLLHRNQRAQAARLFVEMHRELQDDASQGVVSIPMTHLSATHRLALGTALEEGGQYSDAAEVLHDLAINAPDTPEAETALLKVVSLYLHRLQRRDEARTLLQRFAERYPRSTWARLAEQLRRAAQTTDGG